MSVEALSWVLNYSPTTGAEKVILIGIANHADERGRNAWPSVATLARYANITERSAQRALAKLSNEGHIAIGAQRGGTDETRSDRRPNRYEVVGIPQKDASTGCPTRHPVTLHGVSHTSPRNPPRGDAGVANGVTPTSPEPSLEPSNKTSVATTSSLQSKKEEGFDEFYAAYPRREARADALKAWSNLSRDDKAAAMAALPHFVRSAKNTERRFIPLAASWLRGRRWTDEEIAKRVEVAQAPIEPIPESLLDFYRTDPEGRAFAAAKGMVV